MFDLRLSVTVCAVVLLSVTQGLADGLAGPANLPPSTFDGQQFIDNNGCAYARAGVSGTTVWVARVDQTRSPICGLAPTFGAAAVAAAEPASEPAAVEAPVVAAAPRETVGAPIPTVASVSTAPRVAEAAPAAEPAPMRRMTIADICAETAATGQVFTDSATGLPVACAAPPAPAVQAAPVVQPPPVVLAAAVSEPAPVVAAEPLRMTRSEACALGAQNGVRYIDGTTGLPLNCNNAQGAAPSGLSIGGVEVVRPQAPESNAAAPAPYSGAPRGYEHVWTDGRLNPNRGFIPISASQFVVSPGHGDFATRGDFMPLSLAGMQAELSQ